MLTLGGLLFILSGFILFGSDFYFKKGKIKSLKTLLKIKLSALVIAILATLLMLNS
ncbi:hypothetical protein [Thermohalobacter berrensis]|uniref:hypothetical protein n=1 Tax=Thermohalobacter berrensis TaxID=99594 RepID=UPI0015FEE02B|nr:hypothetical protein [Thermohalobacter berrensis]